ncbi:WLM domain-containing protein [Podospora didyma]|uniref:WLM domain-containing protein n=1 Tax=Podospora didyma TaxID=330526 RepID=A0AAE0P781_9PEZI|nr:WLM domain-containing protein [Podospora didyma]
MSSTTDLLVGSFSHLKDLDREKDALHTLKKIASLVKPIMRPRGWHVGQLAEFYPSERNLLGLNVNRGEKILLRLRYPGDRNQFLPFEQVVDTMLHELSHIVYGPHDAKFHALWDTLRKEHEDLTFKGYTGEGFLSDGKRLGGRRMPLHEVRRLTRAAAEKRAVLSSGSGRKLGGAPPRPGEDIRNVIVNAIERRNKTLQGCGNTNHSEREIQDISDSATRNGFKTQAEEDAANEAAIAQALWELVQEDEKAKHGSSYIPPSAANPAGTSGHIHGAQNGYNSSFLPNDESSRKANPPSPPPIPNATKPTPEPTPTEPADIWACNVCTLHNPSNFLSCDACGTSRPAAATQKSANQRGTRDPTVIDLTSNSPPKPSNAKTRRAGGSGGSAQPPAPVVPATWQCSFCGTNMERLWWTCSTCGRLKDSSK